MGTPHDNAIFSKIGIADFKVMDGMPFNLRSAKHHPHCKVEPEVRPPALGLRVSVVELDSTWAFCLAGPL